MKTPRLYIRHANGKGTGSEVEISLQPADGIIMGGLTVRIANQSAVATINTPPTFNWADCATLVLDWKDCAEVLQVFRGECESIGEGKGRSFTALGEKVHYNLTHKIEPVLGYLLEADVERSNGRLDKFRTFFSNAESLGIAVAIESSMSAIFFGR